MGVDNPNLGADVRKILNWVLKNKVGGCGLDLSGSGWGPLVGPGENGNKTWGSIKG
jgi:hypothetical protein